MNKETLVTTMVSLFQETLDRQDMGEGKTAAANSPLIGTDAMVASLGLVSFISDVEAMLAETYDVEVTLVSEKALSRSESPFRTVEALSDYILELYESGNGSTSRAKPGSSDEH